MKDRRKSALDRLTKQLEVGVKPEKVNGKTTNNQISLTDKDRKRIEKEIEILSNK